MSAPPASSNIARHLPRMAASQPNVAALCVPRGRTTSGQIDYLRLTYAELADEVEAWRRSFAARGIQRGDRVLVMVRQGLPLIASVFALFASGAVPVVIDPGMGRQRFLDCVARSRPRALVGIPLAQVLSRVFRRAFATVQVRIPAASRATARLAPPGSAAAAPLPLADSAANELAAILFTSGSTGAPKGVCYQHGMFEAQVRLIRDTYTITPGEVDLPMLPVFALFNPALGMTTVVPEIDPRRPAQVDPAQIVQAVQQEHVTNSFGSPTLWWKIARYCQERSIRLPSLKRVLCAGAPVPPALWSALRETLPNGELHSPYGATEALPVATIAASEVLAGPARATLAGRGTCVGHVLPGNEVRIIALHDGPIPRLADTRPCAPGEIGEIIVRGPTVTQSYDALPEATARAKIPGADASEAAFHRMGDAGHLDEAGRLWFCGRVVERVELPDGPALFPEQVEPIFNTHPRVRRTALVGLGDAARRRAALVVEPKEGREIRSASRRKQLALELHELAQAHPQAARLHLFFFHPQLPVDVRHNAKIHRLALARWAATARGVALEP